MVSFAPIRHFTDHKIRVHLFTRVLALSLAHLMRRECARAGLSLSVPALLAELDGIGETVLLIRYSTTGGAVARCGAWRGSVPGRPFRHPRRCFAATYRECVRGWPG